MVYFVHTQNSFLFLILSLPLFVEISHSDSPEGRQYNPLRPFSKVLPFVSSPFSISRRSFPVSVLIPLFMCNPYLPSNIPVLMQATLCFDSSCLFACLLYFSGIFSALFACFFIMFSCCVVVLSAF